MVRVGSQDLGRAWLLAITVTLLHFFISSVLFLMH